MTCWGQKGEAQLYLYPHKTSALEGGGWSTPRPSHFPAEKETWYPLWRRPIEPWSRSEQVQRISHPPRLRKCYVGVEVQVCHFLIAGTFTTVLKIHLLASSVHFVHVFAWNNLRMIKQIFVKFILKNLLKIWSYTSFLLKISQKQWT